MLGFLLLQTINSGPTIPNALADRLKMCHKLNVQKNLWNSEIKGEGEMI